MVVGSTCSYKFISFHYFPFDLQPEQIRQCLIDYASIGVWDLDGSSEETPGIQIGGETQRATLEGNATTVAVH